MEHLNNYSLNRECNVRNSRKEFRTLSNYSINREYQVRNSRKEWST